MHARHLAIVAFFCAGSCALRVTVHLPVSRADGQRLDSTKIYVSTVQSCEPGGPIVPPANPPPPPSTDDTVNARVEDPERAVVTLFGRGSRCWLHATVWNDANANGKLDTGDALASLPGPLEVEDRGLGWCGGTPVEAPELSLAAVP